MQASPQSSSGIKDTTAPGQLGNTFEPPRPLLATAVIGAALIGYLVHKTPDARLRLESVTNMAKTMGDLTERDASVVAALLAKTHIQNHAKGIRDV
jgi:hypothetical protein